MMTDDEKKRKRAEQQKEWARKNPDRVKAIKAKSNAKNPERARERAAQWYRDNPERAKAQRRASYERNRDKVAAQSKKWREDNPERYRETQLRSALQKKYGITLEQYNAILFFQHGVCAICFGPPNCGQERLDVDHCHDTKRVRGLLCRHCNQGLGHFRDEPERFIRAAAYLTQE